MTWTEHLRDIRRLRALRKLMKTADAFRKAGDLEIAASLYRFGKGLTPVLDKRRGKLY